MCRQRPGGGLGCDRGTSKSLRQNPALGLTGQPGGSFLPSSLESRKEIQGRGGKEQKEGEGRTESKHQASKVPSSLCSRVLTSQRMLSILPPSLPALKKCWASLGSQTREMPPLPEPSLFSSFLTFSLGFRPKFLVMQLP